MENSKGSVARKIFKIIKWLFFILLIGYVILVIFRTKYFFDLDKTNAQVEKIHAATITLDDVMGKNLPPDPGEEADKTLAGVDANANGIRDDVELAIFETYPKSAKTRAALLQYALALQMEFTQPFINSTVVDKVLGEQSRAGYCIADSLVPRKTPESERSNKDMDKIDSLIVFVESKQINTEQRKKAQDEFYKYLGNFADSDKTIECDIDFSTLTN